MTDLGVKSTAAYRVIRQIVDHSWGSDEEFNSEEVILICKTFSDTGGTWIGIMAGDVSCIQKLEEVINSHIENRTVSRAASRIISSSLIW